MRSPTRGARIVILASLLFAVLALAGPSDCGGPHGTRAQLCRRAVSAIAPPDAPIEILHVGRGATFDSVRVDYRITGRAEADTKARRVVCGFGAGTELESVATESGPLTGASVYLLKRFFLDTPETEAPPSPAPSPAPSPDSAPKP